ncbi:MAG: hypothetical protein GX285_01610 [Clostridiales bacterium]|nr:hypothetical protein [Clostridiales bacterium]
MNKILYWLQLNWTDVVAVAGFVLSLGLTITAAINNRSKIRIEISQ